MNYRPEIDGLRALAVVPVIFFHAGFEAFAGGFVGVDVFFVISGYLITTLIFEDMDHDRFSVLRFYERRARRILPALLFVLLCCLPFACLWMLPSQLEDFSKALIAVGLFSSNILFWRQSGYFSAAAEENPLLHTWSLAVEEQYYLIFPFFLLLVGRHRSERALWIIIFISAVSLLLSEWGSRYMASASFYLAPTRAWEILSGSIAALLLRKHGAKQSNLLALVGLLAIGVPVFTYDEATPSPGLYTLVPVLGTVLVIAFAQSDTLLARALRVRWLVGLGLISYSAYLWHQPMFAFARIRSVEPVAVEVMAGLCVAAIAMAALSWRFVEMPFRAGGAYLKSARQVFACGSVAVFGFMLLGSIGYLKNGFDSRLTTAQAELLAYQDYPRKALYREGRCFLLREQSATAFWDGCMGQGRTLLWGDSHAAALAGGWLALDQGLAQFTASACPPLLDWDPGDRPHCKTINQFIISKLNANPAEHVYLHANWRRYRPYIEAFLPGTIDRLSALGVKTITVVGGVPQYSPGLPRRLLADRQLLVSEYRSRADLSEIRAADAILASIAQDKAVGFISVLDQLCENTACMSVVEHGKQYVPVAWDRAHLTFEGAVLVTKRLLAAAP